MKRFNRFKIVLLILVCSLSIMSFAQSLSVTATITDTDGQTWNNGTWSVQLISPNGSPFYNGTPVSTSIQSGTMNGSGALAVTLNNTNTITPSGAVYNWFLCSHTSAPCSNFNTTITVANQSANLSSLITAPRFSTGLNAFGYLDGEVNTIPPIGGFYYNVGTSACQRIWSGSAWACNSGGGGGAVSSVTGVVPIIATPTTGAVVVSSQNSPPILPNGGNFISAGDSLCDGNGLSAGQDWPTLLGALPVLNGITVTNTCHGGLNLAGMIADYAGEVHPHTFAVTGKPCIVAVSIYGNDAPITLSSYETTYAGYVASAHTDGCKVMFMEQWAQTGRQQYDSGRLGFNEYNRTGGSDYYLSTVGRMNEPSNTTMYQGDGQHETLIGSTYVAQQAQITLLGNGQSLGQGNTVFENPSQFYPITVTNPGDFVTTIRNTSNTGADGLTFIDDTNTQQSQIGWGNSGFGVPSNMLYSVSNNTKEHIFLVGSGGSSFIFCIDATQYGDCANATVPVFTLYNGNAANAQMGFFAASGYNLRTSTADQSGAKITFGYQNGTGLGSTRTYTDLFYVNHSGTFTNANASFSIDQSGNATIGGGTNVVYRCIGGTFDGMIAWETGKCTGGTATATSLTIN